ncbi:Protein of unknown function [Actinokineospora alba]|uniref:DUF3558 domain-containing protein n=1 Tax=Actinokineospora alba TaxID=504798 RepID=A0A1H0PTY1_9PSEU|nr:DUF3558 domain-containing protein [Actinokineospora alba]TDP65931.1 uncharacterized protein DUF3558 [Actinokineospora alba]SDI61957.1 Protein of unknown function [Actinokineospora alba]SDP08125.1 Protein of unknown function [Actinokineospora alba]
MRSRAAFSLLALLVVAGCTTSEAGNPRTSESSADVPTTTKSSSTSKTATIPPRPKALKLDSADPCALLTAAQRAELRITRVEASTNGTDIYKGAKQCELEVAATGLAYEYTINLITTEGVEAWLSGKRRVDTTVVSVNGYAGVIHVLKGAGGAKNSHECYIGVDVADGQQLQVGLGEISRTFSQEQICQMTEQAAGMAMTTLQTLG